MSTWPSVRLHQQFKFRSAVPHIGEIGECRAITAHGSSSAESTFLWILWNLFVIPDPWVWNLRSKFCTLKRMGVSGFFNLCATFLHFAPCLLPLPFCQFCSTDLPSSRSFRYRKVYQFFSNFFTWTSPHDFSFVCQVGLNSICQR